MTGKKRDNPAESGPPRRSGRKSKKSRRESDSEHSEASGDEKGAQFNKAKLQGQYQFDFEKLMRDPCFQHPEFVHTMTPEDLNLEFFEKNGLENPIHFRCDPKRIGMTLPPTTFSVDDVLELVGGDRIIEVVEVKTQGSVKMSLKEFVDFYKTPAAERKTLYNVLSLEFSLTPLEDLVKSPALVREIDWVGNKWPDALRQRWVSFAGRDKKHYNLHHTFPKVQNYCLMSVSQCYTDFHIDFSGTSVWYHVLKGRKVFWLIPPTETNFFIYQEFIKTVGSSAFFGKSVEKCHVAILEPGDTMLIPSGWIHAVYTPDDSLVFGGNFLHSQSCKMQTRVYQVENKLNITKKFRLPYNEELLWYVMADYVKQWCGREYARPLLADEAKLDYVGEKWKAAGGHLKKIVYSDYETGVELTSEDLGGGAKSEESKDEVKVIAMHAENSLFGAPRLAKSSFIRDCGLEEEDGEEDQKPSLEDIKPVETIEEIQKRRDAEIDELRKSNPLIFYKNQSHDFVPNKCVPDHKLAVGIEDPIFENATETSKISLRLLEELEALGSYMRRKAKMEMAQGICQPASLLNAFNTILKKRRAELEGKPFAFPPAMTRRTTRSTAVDSTTEQQEMENSRRSSRFKVEDFPDELLEVDPPKVTPKVILPEQPCSGPLEYIPTPMLDDSEERSMEEEEEEEEYVEEFTKEEEVDEEEEEEEEVSEEEPEEDEDDYVPTAPVTRRSSSRKSASKPEEKEVKDTAKKVAQKKEKDEEKERKAQEREKLKEKKQREKERRQKDSELDAVLHAAHGGPAKSKKKKKQEAIVGGLPTSSIQTEPVVSNPYNYDPRMEMMKLGTGQLKSAYRKTRNNVELQIKKNLYKLEPKRTSTEEDIPESSEDPYEYPVYRNSANPQKVNFDYSGAFNDAPAKKMKDDSGHPIHVETNSASKRKEPSGRSNNVYSPLHIPITSPSSSLSSRNPRHSPSPVNFPLTARKGVYMPLMSRQDKMIAEGGGASLPGASSSSSTSTSSNAVASFSAISSRHSSVSMKPRRPSFIPQFTSTPRHSSSDSSNAIYSPTAPVRSSWLPDTSSIGAHSLLEDDSLIDVVNDVTSPRGPSSSSSSRPPFTPPPLNLAEFSSSSRRKSQHAAEEEDGKIPAKEAMAMLKVLVKRLNELNEE